MEHHCRNKAFGNRVRKAQEHAAEEIRDQLKEIKMALLEADVNFKVVKNFVATVFKQGLVNFLIFFRALG